MHRRRFTYASLVFALAVGTLLFLSHRRSAAISVMPIQVENACPSPVTTTAKATDAVQSDSQPDPHRPPCTDKSCKAIQQFVKSHYCADSPYGNGPNDGCDIRDPKKLMRKIKTLAEYHCEWDDEKKSSECKQIGEPSAGLANALRKELKRLGLQKFMDSDLHYTVWASTSEEWTLAEVYYDHTEGLDLTLCEVITVFKEPSELHTVRELPCKKTNVDVPEVTTWSPIDISDVNGDGRQEIVLEGDAYEDHWFEVISFNDSLSPKTVFSGLGYYL